MNPRCLIWSAPQGGKLSYGKSVMYKHRESRESPLTPDCSFTSALELITCPKVTDPLRRLAPAFPQHHLWNASAFFPLIPPFRGEVQLCDSYKPHSKCYKNNVFRAQGCFWTSILDDIFTHFKSVSYSAQAVFFYSVRTRSCGYY